MLRLYVYHCGLQDNCLVSYITAIYSDTPMLSESVYVYLYMLVYLIYTCIILVRSYIYPEVYPDFVWIAS